MAMLGARLAATADPQRVVGYVSDSEWLGLRLFLPASMATLVFGVLLVRTSPWGFDTLWVQLGLAAFVASTVIGMLVFGPGWSKVGAVGRSAGPDVEQVRERIDLLLFRRLGRRRHRRGRRVGDVREARSGRCRSARDRSGDPGGRVGRRVRPAQPADPARRGERRLYAGVRTRAKRMLFSS